MLNLYANSTGYFNWIYSFDGSSSGAAEVSVPVEGNAGVEVGTFEDEWIGWLDYSFLDLLIMELLTGYGLWVPGIIALLCGCLFL